MATKTPIVGTRLAIEGINITSGREAFVASSAQELAEKTVNVLKNPMVGAKLAQNAYSLVADDYNWRKISNKLDEVYRKVGTN